jgi:hypothetical protein
MADTQLVYSYSSNPAPLTANTNDATINLIGTGRATIESLTFTIPSGQTQDALTPSPEAIKITPPKGWTTSSQGYQKGDKKKYDITLAPDGGDTIDVSTDVKFVLHPVATSTQDGTCTVTITEKSTKGTGSWDLQIRKGPAGFAVEYFGLKEAVVKFNGTATLQWKIKGASSYDVIWYPDTTEPALTQHLEAGNTSFDITGLTSATSPVILIAYAKDGNQGTFSHQMATVVLVKGGKVVSGEFIATGAVEVIRKDSIDQDPFSRQVTISDANQEYTFTAATDGLFCAQPTTDNAKPQSPQVTFRIPRDKNSAQSDAEFTLPYQVPMTIPLRRGATLIAQRAKNLSIGNAAFKYCWFPLGVASTLTIDPTP